MKRLIFVALALVVALTCLGFAACGGGDGGTTTSDGDTTPPSGVGLTWADIPVYPGAKQVHKVTWSIPPAEGEWSELDWRYYETEASWGRVTVFYKDEMPDKGWQETVWMQVPEGNWFWYTKNNEQDAAIVWVAWDEEEGKTYIALMRATQ